MRKRIKIVLFCLFAVLSVSSFGQQDPMFTLYMNDPTLINPAYAGTRGNMSLNGVFRKQWVGMQWQPTTTSISANSPFLNNTIGVGFSFMNDQIGPMQQNGFYVDYAYHLLLPNKQNLSLGLKAGFTSLNLNLLDLTVIDWDDVVLMNDYSNAFMPNFGVGAYYYTDKFYAGFSVPLLLKNGLYKDKNRYEIVSREDRVYILTGGGIFTLIEPILKLKPTVLFRAVSGSVPSAELSATLIAYDRVWLGALYRIGDATALHGRFQVTNQLQIGYSYDLTNSDLRPLNRGTHEVLINYVFTRRGERILSPRYF